jgi:DtxR family Mn-dependent transcriptional regulator
MSDRVERKLLDMLPDPSESPYGNPIPGLEELGGPVTTAFRAGVVSLPELLAPDDGTRPAAAEVRVLVRRLGEPLQSDVDLLARLVGSGVAPAREVAVRRDGGEFEVRGDGPPVRLSLSDAGHVFVNLVKSGG